MPNNINIPELTPEVAERVMLIPDNTLLWCGDLVVKLYPYDVSADNQLRRAINVCRDYRGNKLIIPDGAGYGSAWRITKSAGITAAEYIRLQSNAVMRKVLCYRPRWRAGMMPEYYEGAKNYPGFVQFPRSLPLHKHCYLLRASGATINPMDHPVLDREIGLIPSDVFNDELWPEGPHAVYTIDDPAVLEAMEMERKSNGMISKRSRWPIDSMFSRASPLP